MLASLVFVAALYAHVLFRPHPAYLWAGVLLWPLPIALTAARREWQALGMAALLTAALVAGIAFAIDLTVALSGECGLLLTPFAVLAIPFLAIPVLAIAATVLAVLKELTRQWRVEGFRRLRVQLVRAPASFGPYR